MTGENIWQSLPAGAAILAPMEDVTDIVFRGLIRELSGATPPALTFTEFVSLPHFLRGEREALRRLRLDPKEGPVIVQVWGTRPEDYLRGCERLARMGFAGIDINMGCPQAKITRKGACAGLIQNPQLAADLIAAARQGIAASGRQLPLSVKTRIGFSEVRTLEWTGFLLQQNIDALTVHGRIAQQMSEGSADWDEIARVAPAAQKSLPRPKIFGNGDVAAREHLATWPGRYKVDGVMVGRGIFADPYLFSAERGFADLAPAEKLALAREHTQRYRAEYEESRNFEILKKFYKIYVTGFEGADELRAQVMETHSYKAALDFFK